MGSYPLSTSPAPAVQANPPAAALRFRPDRVANAIAIFASAFLLFQVEPIIAKMILPWFGGVAAVWAVCLVFFQTALLLGYLYAHVLMRWLSPRVLH